MKAGRTIVAVIVSWLAFPAISAYADITGEVDYSFNFGAGSYYSVQAHVSNDANDDCNSADEMGSGSIATQDGGWYDNSLETPSPVYCNQQSTYSSHLPGYNGNWPSTVPPGVQLCVQTAYVVLEGTTYEDHLLLQPNGQYQACVG
jgi:hypothetical protein